MDLHEVLKLSVDSKLLSDDIPLFYRQMLYAWYSIKDEPNSINDILSEVLWYTKDVQINNTHVMYKDWYDKEIVYVYDILNNETGKFYTYNEFITKYNVKCSFLKYMSLIDSIPPKWKRIIKGSKDLVINFKRKMLQIVKRKFGCSEKNIEKIKSSDVYWKLLNNMYKPPSCINAWWDKYKIQFDDQQWKCIFQLAHGVTKDTKIRELNAKIVHRVYPSKSYVSHFDKSVNETCNICNVKCDIIHMFYSCQNIKPFWNQFTKWYSQIKQIHLVLTDVIFGIIDKKSVLLNFCLLHAKWYLHRGYKECTYNREYKPSFLHYLIYLKYAIQVEETISINYNREDYYGTYFTILDEIL